MVPCKAVYAAAHAGVDEDLDEGEGGACRVGGEGEGVGGGEEDVHEVVGVGCDADEEEKLGTLLDSAHDAFQGGRVGEEPRQAVTEIVAREEEDDYCAGQGRSIGYDGAGPYSECVSGKYNERRV